LFHDSLLEPDFNHGSAVGMPLLFSYGTLQQERVQLAIFGRLLRGERDHLAGFELSDVEIDDPAVAAAGGATHYANLTYSGRAESRVKGMVFEMTEAELAAADEYEKQAHYQRRPEKLASGRMAWAYIYVG
jgi:gamma-glutamylcyclotransferase (GGCT)/AIG2-like uncharacterized protein YtfP